MALNDSFVVPRRTQKVTSTQPVEVINYVEHVGNLPSNKRFDTRIPQYTSGNLIGQAFKATENQVKAIGVWLRSDFRASGGRRDGKVMCRLYEWTNYPNNPDDSGEMTLMADDDGNDAVVEIEIEDIKDRNESIFEFPTNITTDVGSDYFFTISQTEGYAPSEPLYLATSSDAYGTTIGEAWEMVMEDVWPPLFEANSSRFDPDTDLVFQVYQSISELAVTLQGDGDGSLTGIQDHLTVGEGEAHAYFGIVDYFKPYQTHKNAVVEMNNVGLVTNTGELIESTGGAWGGAGNNFMLYMGVVDVQAFSGIGVDDMTSDLDSVYTGLEDLYFTVKIDAVGPPDTFEWYARDADGNTISSATGVAITGASQTIYKGIAVTFADDGTVTPHTVGDEWTFTVACWDEVQIRVTDDILIDWGDGADTLDCDGNPRLLKANDAIVIPEFVAKLALQQYSATTDVVLSMTGWRTRRP